MPKFKYICYWYISPEGRALGMDDWKKYFAKEEALAKKNGVSILFRGIPYGVSDSLVTVYESEKFIDNLQKVVLDPSLGRSKYVEASNTIVVNPF